MKNLALVFLLTAWSLGQAAGNKDIPVTSVAGESWLTHLHRTFEETSMGKTGRLGPATASGAEDTPGGQRLSSDSRRQTVILRGSDLYRLNCRGCHGEFGLGTPPEINSVIDPTRATSITVVMERMKDRGMNISRADAAELAKQSKTSLLQRLHNGGTDMPPFHHLSELEVRAIFAYLKQLAGVPGAEKQQASIEESRLRVGEHIVKSTCHICHDAAGPNPSAEQLFKGAIPPLNTLTTRTSLPEFEQKIRSGAPILMGTPPSPFRGRMPVFYYLSDDEAADAYLYLRLYPPYEWAVLDSSMPAPEKSQAASNLVPVVLNGEPTTDPPPGKETDRTLVNVPLIAEIFVGFLLLGGLGFTLLEIRRLSAQSENRKALVIGDASALHATHSVSNESPSGWVEQIEEPASPDDAVAAAESAAVTNDHANGDHELAQSNSSVHHIDYRTFESSWLARRFEKYEKEDWVA